MILSTGLHKYIFQEIFQRVYKVLGESLFKRHFTIVCSLLQVCFSSGYFVVG